MFTTILPDRAIVGAAPSLWTDADALLYGPLTVRGITPAVVTTFSITPHVAACSDDDQRPRLWWRYPVTLADGTVVAHRLAAVDSQQWPRSRWDGPATPTVLYNTAGIVPGDVVLVVAHAAHTWMLASIGIAAVSFLCGPWTAPPALAIAQMSARRPLCAIVVDDWQSGMPDGAVAVVRALRAAGVPAGAVRMPDYLPPTVAPEGSTMLDLCGAERFDPAAIMARLQSLPTALPPFASATDGSAAR